MRNFFRLFSGQGFKGYFWLIILLFIPVLFSKSLIDEDNIPKLIGLCILTIILACRSAFSREYRDFDKTEILFTGIIFIYFFFCLDRANNFSSGITSYLSLLLPFSLFLLMRANRIFDSTMIFSGLAVAALLLCAVALIQYFILLPEYNFLPPYLVRSTMSNKNFLSEALVFYLFFSVAAIISTPGFVRRLSIISGITSLCFITFLHSLSAWLACLAGSILFVVFYFFLFSDRTSGKRKLTRLLVPLLPGVFIVIFIAARYGITGVVENKITSTYRVLTGETDYTSESEQGNTNSTFERLYLWKNTIRLISENPMTGQGLSDWQIYWPKYGIGGAEFLESGVMHYEHPHNEFLFFLAETGWAGLACLLLFFGYFLFRAVRYIFNGTDHRDRKIVLVMAVSLIAFFIMSAFGYPMHRPYTVFLLMLVCLFITEVTKSKNPDRQISSAIIPAVLLVISLMSLNVFINRLTGEFFMDKALNYQAKGNFSGMLRMVRKAENRYFTLDPSSTPLDWYKGFSMYYSGNDSAYYYFQRSETINPYHVQTLSDIGALLENQGRHKEAIEYFNRITAIIPGYYEAHFNLAVAYYNLNQYEKALHHINVKPGIDETYLNTLDAILNVNGKMIADSCDKYGNANRIFSDKNLLREINRLARINKSGFRDVLCDSMSRPM
jgi:O-antigen ligase